MRPLQRSALFLAAQLTLALLSSVLTSAAEIDESTSGAWPTKYGAAGYLIPEGPAQMNYPAAHFVNASRWLWTRVTGLPQAPEYPFTRGGIASCWYSATSFETAVSFPDRNGAAVAFYFLDWDKQQRVQLVEVLDAFDRVTSQVELRDFENGKYLIVRNTDVARLRITRLAGPNAVLSGIFVGGPFIGSALATPPTISPGGGDFQGPVDVELFPPTEDSVPYFTLNGADPTVNGIPYNGPIRLTESHTLRAVTRSKYGQSPESVAIFNLAPIPDVEFLGEDRTTQGAWMGNYGNGAYVIPHLQPTMPVTLEGTEQWVWNWSSSDPSALQKPSAPGDRFAPCWYNINSFDISVPIGRDIERTVSVYALDWDHAGRVQQIDIIDTERQLVVDSQSVSNFADGVYLRWTVRNDVTIRVIRQAGPNAVLSGVFLDPGPIEQVEAPGFVYGGPPGEPVTVNIGTGTAGAEIYYTLDGSTPTRDSTLYTAAFQLLEDATVSAIAFKNGMFPSPVSSVFIEAAGPGSPGGPTVEFVAEDSATQGTWRGAYGAAAYWIAGDASFIPHPYKAEILGSQDHVWAFNISAPAALQKATSPERIAACRYATDTFSITVDQGSPTPRALSLYFLDWDESGRVQNVELLDANGSILDTRTVADFENGKYLTWRVTGQITIRVTRVQGPNAVISALFID